MSNTGGIRYISLKRGLGRRRSNCKNAECAFQGLAKVPLAKQEEVLSDGYTENVTVADLPLSELIPGVVLRLGQAEVEILYVGKKAWKEHGRPYIISREGRFGRIVKGGRVRVGDSVEILER